jgi:hypothetical protein
MRGVWAVQLAYEQTYPQKLGRGFLNILLDISYLFLSFPHQLLSEFCRKQLRRSAIANLGNRSWHEMYGPGFDRRHNC